MSDTKGGFTDVHATTIARFLELLPGSRLQQTCL